MKPTLLILAAGMGSRYGGLKQIDQVGPAGETIIDYSIYDAIRAGYGKVVLVVRESILEEMKAIFDPRWGAKITLAYAIQEVNVPIAGIENLPHREKPWGTAHAIMVAKNKIAEPFAVINADDFYGADAFATVGRFLRTVVSDKTYAMAGYILKNTLSDHGYVSRGITETDSGHNLTSITERTKIQRIDDAIMYEDEGGNQIKLNENSFVSMNFWAFSPAFFNQAELLFKTFVAENAHNSKAEFFIPLVVEHLMQQKQIKVKVLENNAKWMGVTYREDKPVVMEKIQALVNTGIYPKSLFD